MRSFHKIIGSTFSLCCMASYSVNAVEIYKSDTVSATIGGYYQIQHISSEGTDELIDNRSRISFGFDNLILSSFDFCNLDRKCIHTY